MKNPHDTAVDFCESLASGNHNLAFSYCTEDIDNFSFNDLLEYYTGNLPGSDDILYTNIQHSEQDKVVLYTCYGGKDPFSYKSPSHIIRMVLFLEKNRWKIKHLRNLRECLPTQIMWAPELAVSLEDTYTNFPCIVFTPPTMSRFRLFMENKSNFIARYDIFATSIKLYDMLPGLHASFGSFEQEEERGFLECPSTEHVHLKKTGQDCYDLRCSITGEA